MQEWQWPSRGKESVQAAYSGKDVYLQLKKKKVEHRLHKENTDYDSQDEVRQKKKKAFFSNQRRFDNCEPREKT